MASSKNSKLLSQTDSAQTSDRVAETAHWYCPDNTSDQQTITPSATPSTTPSEKKSNAIEGIKVHSGMGIKKIVHSILSHIGH